ncbi:probable inactive ATP-dependent zinc metalloprotease FTSHI 1, chloroplastic [Cucumis melo]|uniref:Probable inactive ATP-dependent zinc metalloprotease FTSHI 1, chloroplastic n=1 Tax=Cucumis melo TaxID=3656 RepID=A0ABM3KYB7_CUCME|nr:probable inactive ATP-dependent zinc metalloprotease FTSHI 1, chloroplastic [Cucumis melo]
MIYQMTRLVGSEVGSTCPGICSCCCQERHESIVQSDMDDAVDWHRVRSSGGQCRRATTEMGVAITSHLLRRYESAKVECCDRISIIPRGQVLIFHEEIIGEEIDFILDNYPPQTPISVLFQEENPGRLPSHGSVEPGKDAKPVCEIGN